MKVLLTGASGQLGQCVQDVLPKEWQLFAFNSQELDITNLEQVESAFEYIKPDAVINAAAYTKVDQAESEVGLAFHVNATGVHHLALCSKKHGARLIHISTDYVFNGTKKAPYTETDPTNPINVYGQSKLAGENLALATHINTLILRTSWVFSEYGNNFLKTMLRVGENNSELKIVGDQIGTPTYAGDIANTIIHLILNQKELRGILNVAGNDICSWASFAKKIFKISDSIHTDYIAPTVIDIPTQAYPTPAKRPLYSVLDIGIAKKKGIKMRSLEENIQCVLSKLEP
ncbi:MAG: dTDP-4-dehydrorhamnose reductase [Xanthomonadaceae bacterium]|nr:dTDP-4-dehydrorhamnose reductase [Xanthomonadaceae bacterium]